MSASESNPKAISGLLKAIAVVSQTQEREALAPRAAHTPESAAEMMSWALASGLESQEQVESLVQRAKIALAETEALREREQAQGAKTADEPSQSLKTLMETISEAAQAQREAWQMMQNVKQAIDAIAQSNPGEDPSRPARVSPMLQAAFDEVGSPRAQQNLTMILDACLGSAALNSAPESPAMILARAQADELRSGASSAFSASESKSAEPARAEAPASFSSGERPAPFEAQRPTAAPAPETAFEEPRAQRPETASASDRQESTEASASGAVGTQWMEELIKAGASLIKSSNPHVDLAKQVIIKAASDRIRSAGPSSKPNAPADSATAPEAPKAPPGPSATAGAGLGLDSTLIDVIARQLGSKIATEGVERAAEAARGWMDSNADKLRKNAGGAGSDLGGLLAEALRKGRASRAGADQQPPESKPPKGPGA